MPKENRAKTIAIQTIKTIVIPIFSILKQISHAIKPIEDFTLERQDNFMKQDNPALVEQFKRATTQGSEPSQSKNQSQLLSHIKPRTLPPEHTNVYSHSEHYDHTQAPSQKHSKGPK